MTDPDLGPDHDLGPDPDLARDLPPNARAAALPAFLPVPRLKDRSNGWKPEVQRAFIAALAETGSVRAACRRVNRSEHGAYQLRAHPEGAEFRRAWDAALDMGVRRIEDIAMERAIHGVDVPVYSYGKLVGTRTVHNDRLLMFLLRNRAPDRFAGDGAATSPLRLARLKQQWRKEWEAERAAESERRGREAIEGINRKLGLMRDRMLAIESPETVAARKHYEALRRRDEERDYNWRDYVGEGEEEDGDWDEDGEDGL